MPAALYEQPFHRGDKKISEFATAANDIHSVQLWEEIQIRVFFSYYVNNNINKTNPNKIST